MANRLRSITGIKIIGMKPDHWPEVKTIYEEGIATGKATFETTAGDWEKWDSSHLKDLRFVACENEMVLGWVALSPASGRCVYGGVAEVSVYVRLSVSGRGIGSALLNHLIEQSEKAGYWTLQAGIFEENTQSIRLHEKCGFRIVGKREKLGQLHGEWKDIILMERRSIKVG